MTEAARVRKQRAVAAGRGTADKEGGGEAFVQRNLGAEPCDDWLDEDVNQWKVTEKGRTNREYALYGICNEQQST